MDSIWYSLEIITTIFRNDFFHDFGVSAEIKETYLPLGYAGIHFAQILLLDSLRLGIFIIDPMANSSGDSTQSSAHHDDQERHAPQNSTHQTSHFVQALPLIQSLRLVLIKKNLETLKRDTITRLIRIY